MDDHLMAMDRAGGKDCPTAMTEEPLHPDQMEEAAPTVDEPTPETEQSAPALRLDGGTAEEPALGSIIEALLFASDAPLSPGKLAELAGAGTPTAVRKEIAALNDKYEATGLAFRVEQLAGGFQMLSLSSFDPWLAKLDKQRSRTRLTSAAMETLAIVAYKQPVIRAEIEAIRGVACGEALNRLREMGLVKIIGRADVIGRPMLYGTTRKFLDLFGLADLDDLPPLEALALRRGPEPEGEQADEDRRAASA